MDQWKITSLFWKKKNERLYNKNSNNHKTTLILGGSAHVVHMSTIIKDKKEYMDGKTKREVEMHQMDLKSKKMQYNALAMVNRSEAKKLNPSISQNKLNSLFLFESYE